ncbi:hypothetical protein QN360_02520 [Glaciimonas sp. CA11.2]|uniref:hypothetical protein n=1 Tax=Glaciimonas sp. CA11.2 TaxID=3048601 RepID=UPI002B227AF9|nr:hypothetical protein [Glaciimonas sp. CA11.2]MEB0161779.1 hypothetical protein [Glaciimonas sp. CA11.2]
MQLHFVSQFQFNALIVRKSPYSPGRPIRWLYVAAALTIKGGEKGGWKGAY